MAHDMHAALSRTFKSERLLYRSVESPEDDDFVFAMVADADAEISSSISLPKPKSKKDAQAWIKDLNENPKVMLAVIVCLDPEKEGDAPQSGAATAANPDSASSSSTAQPARRPLPIGLIHLIDPYGAGRQHRQGQIGINIVPSHQGHGYGAESIRWLLQWGFDMAGLHRIRLGVFEWNAKAIRLYKRIGFRLESTEKEALWFSGRWWDNYWMAILEHEWREKWRDVREVYNVTT